MSKHQPATPLPWYDGKDKMGRSRIFCESSGIEVARALWKAVKTKSERDKNRAYITHSANAYPKLVAMLWRSALDENYKAQDCLDLLEKLGEKQP